VKDHPRQHGIAAVPAEGTDLNAAVLRAWARTAELWRIEGDPYAAPPIHLLRVVRRKVEPG
jgi:hypothetical protein